MDMSTVNSTFDREAWNERKHLLAEEDRRGFLKVVIAAGIALFVMFFVLLSVLLMAGQKGMPLDSRYQDANASLALPVAQAAQRTGSNQALACLRSMA